MLGEGQGSGRIPGKAAKLPEGWNVQRDEPDGSGINWYKKQMSHGLGKGMGVTSVFDVLYLRCQWIKELCLAGKYVSLQWERSEPETDLGTVNTEITSKVPERMRSPRTAVCILLHT